MRIVLFTNLTLGGQKTGLIDEGLRAVVGAIDAENPRQRPRTALLPVGFASALRTCPIVALRRWLETAAIDEGRVFRRIDRHGHLGQTLSDRALAAIIAARVGVAGLEGDFARHSLRVWSTTAGLPSRATAVLRSR